MFVVACKTIKNKPQEKISVSVEKKWVGKGAGIVLFQKRNDEYAILLGKRTISPQKKGNQKVFEKNCKMVINML